MFLYFIITLSIVTVAAYIYWRFFFFYRDPERETPFGNSIVSPADGTIVYIKKIDENFAPISIKKGRKILISEILKSDINFSPAYLVGIFMHPSSVHVNRAPISGEVSNVVYTKSNNFPMTIMWWRVLLGIKPYELHSFHVINNERNTIFFKGEISAAIVQIADIYVNKIECWVKKGQYIDKGERVGMIKMGSQVDLIFSSDRISSIEVGVGQKVKAGESIIALYQ